MKFLQYLLIPILAVVGSPAPAKGKSKYVAPWQTLPPTPSLPKPYWSGTAPINGIKLWHALFGRPLSQCKDGAVPVVFLHGGFANSDYFGHQIRHLAESSLSYSIVAVDTRGHGRSTDDLSRPLSYDLIAEDTIALMDHLKVKKFAVVGWSDGACTGFNLAMNYTERVDRVFSFGGTYSYTNVNETIGDSPVFTKYLDRVKVEYEHVSPTPQGYATFEERMGAMWSVEPVWRAESFQKIPSLFDNRDAPLMWIVDGDSEEACKRDVPRTLFDWIWGSAMVLLPSTSHFAFLQDPDTFNAVLDRFLATHR
ncbi:hypothetical protein NLU13_7872 [Sarocladium strictum]|uniref:AB hydrolase-1 domain-containing protein n=1 Tax=Sarocladium strictum TaxID=5046 RepID=A0AA39L5L8_SARSR|nr:hypothetical protein NLU13_7872 [Sarocladium strictum]